ncbi:MAG TPA: RimK family alpha-L-glutamate ligase [Rhodothermales bacterium]|nr:RimK family alpha-L-glutamate ligase [Rhodothermales bacterium]
MGKLAVYVERYTIARPEELEALMRFKNAAEAFGHEIHYLFRSELQKIPHYDALFIRALTDPLNASYVASRIAEMHGLPVIDDARSIRICCDKVTMYRLLAKAGIPIPPTRILRASDVTKERAEEVFAELGRSVVMKAPHSSFSSHVEKVDTPEAFVETGHRFLHRADRIVVQGFVKTTFDWRVGVLNGEALYTCRYLIPAKTFKIQAVIDGKIEYGRVETVPVDQAPPHVVETAIRASNRIGRGLYGVDLKETADGGVVVIEVNDNPSINAGDEDRYAPDLYERIVRYLLEERQMERFSGDGHLRGWEDVELTGQPFIDQGGFHPAD